MRGCAAPSWRRRAAIGGGGGAQAGAGVDEGAAAVAAELVFERLGGGDEQVVDLVVRAGAGLGRRAARHGEHADRLDGAVSGFGHSCGVAGEHSTRRGLGVGGVGLAAPAARLAVRAVHLPHAHTRRGEVAGEAGAVAAGAFDADAAQLAQRRQPGGQFAVTGARRRERRRRQQPPDGVDSCGDMGVTVRVNAAEDLGVLLGHNGAALLGQPTDTGHHRAGTADRDTQGGQLKAPIRSRPPDRSVRVPDQQQADRSGERHHGQHSGESDPPPIGDPHSMSVIPAESLPRA